MTHLLQAGCNISYVYFHVQTQGCVFWLTCVHPTKSSCHCACFGLRHHPCCRLAQETETAQKYAEVAQPYTEVAQPYKEVVQHGIYSALLLMRLACIIAGPSSLGYSQSGPPASGQSVGFQVQGPQGPSAAPPGWFPAPATGKALPSQDNLTNFQMIFDFANCSYSSSKCFLAYT